MKITLESCCIIVIAVLVSVARSSQVSGSQNTLTSDVSWSSRHLLHARDKDSDSSEKKHKDDDDDDDKEKFQVN